MAKLIIVRHAESIANTQGIYQGQTYDTGLSELGKKQAKSLASKVALFNIDKVISSPLKRTRETAEAITEKRIVYDARVIETNHGIWEGKNKKWIMKHYPEVLREWLSKPANAEFPKGEKFPETVKRVKDFIHDTNWKGTTLLVTHDNIIRIIICMAKNNSINEMWNVYLEPAAISIFEIKGIDGRKKLKTLILNDTSHLENFRANVSEHAL